MVRNKMAGAADLDLGWSCERAITDGPSLQGELCGFQALLGPLGKWGTVHSAGTWVWRALAWGDQPRDKKVRHGVASNSDLQKLSGSRQVALMPEEIVICQRVLNPGHRHSQAVQPDRNQLVKQGLKDQLNVKCIYFSPHTTLLSHLSVLAKSSQVLRMGT